MTNASEKQPEIPTAISNNGELVTMTLGAGKNIYTMGWLPETAMEIAAQLTKNAWEVQDEQKKSSGGA